jgi:hypothetical protein
MLPIQSRGGGDSSMDILQTIGFLLGISGVGASIYFGIENRRLSRLQNRFAWPDIERACRRIGTTMRTRTPDLIVCFQGPSAVIANLTIAIRDIQVPIIIISLRSRGLPRPYDTESLDDVEVLTSSKWVLSVPKQLFLFHAKSICIVEDAIVTGDSLGLLKDALLSKGFDAKKIWTTTVVCTDIARESNKSADEAYFFVNSSTFYFPWGKGG